jgi:acyl carrier protein
MFTALLFGKERNRNMIQDKFWEIVQQYANIDVTQKEIKSFTSDLNMSSFEMVQLIVDVEETFGIELMDDLFDLEELDNPEKFIDLIKRLVGKNI